MHLSSLSFSVSFPNSVMERLKTCIARMFVSLVLAARHGA